MAKAYVAIVREKDMELDGLGTLVRTFRDESEANGWIEGVLKHYGSPDEEAEWAVFPVVADV